MVRLIEIARELVKRLPGGRWALLALLFAALMLGDYLWLRSSRIVDQWSGDVLLSLNAQRRPVSENVVIVNIDQRSLEEMNDLAGSWPWPRSVHGELIEHLAAQQPRAIIFDILFNEADIYRPEHDDAFAAAVAAHENTWLAMTLNANGDGAPMLLVPPSVGAKPLTDPPAEVRIPIMLPLAVAQEPGAMRGGLVNFRADSDGVGRRHDLYLDRKGWRFASLPARVAGDPQLRLPERQSILLNWRRGWDHVSYSDVYLDSLRAVKRRPQDEFRGKIVIIGTTAPGLLDLRRTPLASDYPGVEILATATDNLVRGDWLEEVPRTALLPLALALVGLLAAAFARNVSANRTGLALFATSLVGVLAASIALTQGAFLPIFAVLAFAWAYFLTASAIAYLEERAQRLRTFGMFKRFLDPRVVSELIERGEIDLARDAESREVTVLFTDIRGFTAMSEKVPPEEVVAMLNSYLARQVEVIFRHGGTLDKFMGDAIMAFWGAPLANPDHARHALEAAIDMSATLEVWRSEIGTLGHDLEIGIGIHSGPAVVGFIGSGERLDYTVIGDTVNLASRIEGLTKGVARILVSDATRAAAGDGFAWRGHGSHPVKGRNKPVLLFEPEKNGSSQRID